MKTNKEIIDMLAEKLGKDCFFDLARHVNDFIVYEDMDAFVQGILDKADELDPPQNEEIPAELEAAEE